ncbi:MAG: hypothetical protein AABZ31_14525 [Bdellovibrionota bacterium]
MSTQKIIIVGQNTSAFLTAYALTQAGHKVTLVESGNTAENLSSVGAAEIEAVPSDAATFEAVAWLETVLATSTISTEAEMSPATLSDGETKPFLGFGDSPYKSISPLSAYNLTRRLKFKPYLAQLMATLRVQKNFAVIPYSEVTAIDDLDQKIRSITVNGQQLEADYFIFTEHPKTLTSILPADVLGTRIKSKIAKSATWTEIRLIFQHKNPLFIADHVLYLLPPSIRNEPFIGQFQLIDADDGTSCRSVWQSYVESELAEDPEIVSTTMKHMKKTLQKVFSNSNEFTKEQFIVVNPDSYGDFSWAKDGFGFEADLTNMIMAIPVLYPIPGIMGCVMAAYAAVTRITNPAALEEKSTNLREPSLLSSSDVADHGA